MPPRHRPMQKALRPAALVGSVALLLANCSYKPDPVDLVRIWDSSIDMRACRHVSRVAGATATGPGFEDKLEDMREAVLARGGTDLYLRRTTHDFAYVTGEAYRCPRNYSGFATR